MTAWSAEHIALGGEQLRPAEPADLSQIEAVARDAYAVYVARMAGQRPAPMDDDYAIYIEQASIWVVARPAIAFIVAFAGNDKLSGDLVTKIETVAVSPEHQGKGLGKAMIAAVERNAVQTGSKTLKLYTNEAMTQNLSYYPKLGYRETHRAVENGFRRVYFEKALSA